jgi:AcrR family transcriptional regulator
MTTRLPAAERRKQLLGIAVEVFGGRGFHAASMDDVARAAGVTKPVLYQHFQSKRDLYREVLEDVGEQLLVLIGEQVAAHDQPQRQVEAAFEAYFRWVGDHPSAFGLLFGGGPRRDGEFSDVVRDVEERVAGAVAVRIAADLDPVHRRTLAFGLVGLAEATARHWLIDAVDIEPERLARQVADLAWAGLRGVRRVD